MTAPQVRSPSQGHPTAPIRAEDITVEYDDPGYQAANSPARQLMATLNPLLALRGVLRWPWGAATFEPMEVFPEHFPDLLWINVVEGPAAGRMFTTNHACCSNNEAIAERLSHLEAVKVGPGKPRQ